VSHAKKLPVPLPVPKKVKVKKIMGGKYKTPKGSPKAKRTIKKKRGK